MPDIAGVATVVLAAIVGAGAGFLYLKLVAGRVAEGRDALARLGMAAFFGTALFWLLAARRGQAACPMAGISFQQPITTDWVLPLATAGVLALCASAALRFGRIGSTASRVRLADAVFIASLVMLAAAAGALLASEPFWQEYSCRSNGIVF